MKSNRIMKRGSLVSAAFMSGICGIYQVPVVAAEPALLEEVVVTARKRSERLQDVPVAVSAFTEATIEDAGINRAADFIALTPNVTFANSESAGVNFLTIRGLSQVRNGESPVAVVIDGVLMTDPGQFDQELFDIQQIEILKGPQGALYGRNAIGGAINITTKDASEELEGKVKIGAGNGNRKKIQGAVSGPLAETLSFRLAGSYVDHDGYIDNEFLNKEVDPYEDTTIRGRLNWQPTENFSADLRISRSETEGGSLNFVVNADYNAFDFVGDADNTDVDIIANRIGENERDITSVSLKLDYETDFATITSVTSWDDQEEFYAASAFPYECNPTCPVSLATTPISFFLGASPQLVKVFTEVEAFSQEIRLTSSDDQPLRWIAGLYYLQTDRFRGLPTEADLGQSPSKSVFNANTIFGFADDNDNEAFAAFGQFNYDLNDDVELSLALRYDRDEREQTDVAPVAFSATSGLKRDETYSEVQPKFTVRYQPDDNLNLFATWSKGFRSGGFNQNGVGAAAAAAGISGISDDYEKEVSTNIELGFKTVWLDGQLKVNGGIFRTEVEDQHFFQFLGAINAQLLNNIDEVLLQGAELDVHYQVSDSLDLYGAFGYTDSEIEDYTVTPADEGNWAPYVPKTTFNLGFQYHLPISDNVEGMLRVDYERRGKQFWDTANSTERSALNLVNARIGLQAADDSWSLIAWSKNLTDKEYNAEFVRGGFASIAAPRIYGIDFTKRF